MIDRFVFTAMTGAKSAMGQLATTSHNMANLQTPGFREMLSSFRAVPVTGTALKDDNISLKPGVCKLAML